MSMRLLNIQGLAGIAASVVLLCLLLMQKAETRHWRKQSTQNERLYRAEQNAFAATVGSYRAAAEAARAADRATAERVAGQQRDISERIVNDYEKRLAAARAAADRLQRQAQPAPTDPRAGRAAPMPSSGTGAGRAADAADDPRLFVGTEDLDWRLVATEQAIQLDELIRWVKAQSALDPNADTGNSAAPATGTTRR